MRYPLLHRLLCLLFLYFAIADTTYSHPPYLNYQILHLTPLQAHNNNISLYQEAAPDHNLKWMESAHDTLKGASVTLKLEHRDSPTSPLRNPHATPEQLFLLRLKRDKARANAISTRDKPATNWVRKATGTGADSTAREEDAIAGFTGPLTSGLKQGSGEYFTRIGVGTPARQVYMVVDTGSDIIWLQCALCVDCYDQADPIFNPAYSSSYRRLSCMSPFCRMLELHECKLRSNVCLYQVSYGDGSFTAGEFSMEAVSFNGATMEGVVMGCGHDNEGLFAGAAGLFGLGGGALSFPSQMGRQYNKVFSYCLMKREKEGYSTLLFGDGGVPRGTLFTPLLRNPNFGTYYYVSLIGISVGGHMLSIPQEAFEMDGNGEGGVIVDSGTSVTRLIDVAYGPLRSAFRAASSSLLFSGGFSLFDTCYDLSGQASVRIPTLSLHFEGGAEMALPASNYVIPVDAQGTYCLAFANTLGDLSIIGNIQQQGFRIVFDGVSSRLGFAANQC